MERPLGYTSKAHPGYVYKLKKALHRLKQALTAWYGKIAEFLQFCGYHSTDGDLHMVVLLYVDDMIMTGSDEMKLESYIWAELSTRFDMKNLGELGHFLGLEVENMKDGIFLSQ